MRLAAETHGFERWGPLLGLALALAVAAVLRLGGLVPLSEGLAYPQDYDEAVWGTSAQLLLQGRLPYRDFFATLPPVGIYLLAAVLRLAYAPWGSPAGFMAMRYASVAYGLAGVCGIYWVGRKLGGAWAGVVAAVVLALDGMAVGLDRRAMLEPPLNLLSILAIGVYLCAAERAVDERGSRVLAGTAGVLSALAALVKTPGLVVILALATVSAFRRRWAELIALAAGFALTWLVASGVFLLRCPGDLIRQVYFFQLLRPPDGLLRRTMRLLDIWRNGLAWLTVRLGLVGGVWSAARTWVRRRDWMCCIVIGWLGYAAVLIWVNGSYWSQYYVQLVPPLALLGGCLAVESGKWACRMIRSQRAVGMLVLVMLSGFVLSGAVVEVRGTLASLSQRSTVYNDVAQYLRLNTNPQDEILAFEPNYTFLASRPLAGTEPGRYWVDSYGEMLYVNMGLANQSIPELVVSAVGGNKGSLQAVFWRPVAQEQVQAIFGRAEYVIVDGRARYQVEPSVLEDMRSRSVEVLSAGIASVRRITPGQP